MKRKIKGGDCYYIAGQFAMDNVFSPKKIDYKGTPYLVHAEVQGQGKVSNLRYGHAWIEDDENVYDFSNGRELIIPKFLYYAIGDIRTNNPKKYQKYTFSEARKRMLQYKHYGCWDLDVEYKEGGEVISSDVLLAPNGKPTNLTSEQYRLVRTPEFKAWFGDWEKAYETGNYDNVSKVIDEETKEPLVVYHGSPIGETNVFDLKKAEDSIVSSGLREYGMYFTTNKNIAKIYQAKKRLQTDEYKSTLNTLEEKRNKVRNNIEYDKLNKQIDFLYYGRIYEVFLNLKKIVSFDAKGMANIEAYNNLKVDVGYDLKQGREAMYFFKTGYSHAKSIKEVVTVEKVDGIRADNVIELSEYGALSSYEKNKYIGTSFLVFPNEDVFYNVKLADGTNTTFDSNNPDIRYADGGSIPDLLSSQEVEYKLGRDLHWWNDDIVYLSGIEYKKVYLRPEYKKVF